MGTKTNMKPYNPINWPAVPHDFSGDNNLGIYAEETTDRYICGTRFTRWDGSVFKYTRSITEVMAGMGTFNDAGVVNIAVTALTVAVGDREMTFTLGGTDGYAGDGVVAEDELIGGYLVTGHAANDYATRLLMGNTAGATSLITVLLDGPLPDALTTPFTEVVLNPYRYVNGKLGGSSGGVLACIGMSLLDAGALTYTWQQTYGPFVCTGSNSYGNAANQRDCYVVEDGSVRDGSEITIENGYQRIGFGLDATDSGTGMLPLIMLQISI